MELFSCPVLCLLTSRLAWRSRSTLISGRFLVLMYPSHRLSRLGFSWLSSVPPGKSREIISIGPRPLPYKSFKGPIHDQSCCATWLIVCGADWLDREWANLCCAKQFCTTWLIVYGPLYNSSFICRTTGRYTLGLQSIRSWDSSVGVATVLESVFNSQQACHLFARWFAELFFDPEDGADTFFRNVGYNSTHYTASYPRRRYSSKPPIW
jgi:hypothetical protein